MCVISTSEGNDDMIIPRQENPDHALMRVGNDGNSNFARQNRIVM
jgi:hypothetical protein